MTALVLAFAAGLAFAIGLGLGGMTDPARVLAFLDVAGRWDPSLAFVMGGAILVHAPTLRLALARGRPVAAPRFELPTRRDLDWRLLTGAAVFGCGWGLGGYCPGPAVASLGAGAAAALVFVPAMLAGMALERVILRR